MHSACADVFVRDLWPVLQFLLLIMASGARIGQILLPCRRLTRLSARTQETGNSGDSKPVLFNVPMPDNGQGST
jgi:hypothetical protein